jgi:nicotinic acid phosphoribosyltransferase
VSMPASDLSGRIDALADKVRAKHAAERVARAAADQDRVASMGQRRDEMRKAMPEVAGLVDLFRSHGVEVKVLAAEENGRVVMTRDCERMGVDVSRYSKQG